MKTTKTQTDTNDIPMKVFTSQLFLLRVFFLIVLFNLLFNTLGRPEDRAREIRGIWTFLVLFLFIFDYNLQEICVFCFQPKLLEWFDGAAARQQMADWFFFPRCSVLILFASITSHFGWLYFDCAARIPRKRERERETCASKSAGPL